MAPALSVIGTQPAQWAEQKQISKGSAKVITTQTLSQPHLANSQPRSSPRRTDTRLLTALPTCCRMSTHRVRCSYSSTPSLDTASQRGRSDTHTCPQRKSLHKR